MRHRVALKKLNADTQHRLAMRRNMARSLFLHGRVVTTSTKAKAFRPFVERLVTRARKAHTLKDTDRAAYIHALRVLRRDIPDREALKILVDRIAPLCAQRQGGYTRILRDAKNQLGDNAPRAIWEFVDRPKPEAAPEGGEGEATEATGAKGARTKTAAAKAPSKASGEKPAAKGGAKKKSAPAKPDAQADEA
jgi:large subunit ribosomal protein L17